MTAVASRVDEVCESLRHSIEVDRLAQAYLVIGSPEGDAAELTDLVLGLLFCSGDTRPCGQCRECVAVSKRSHPDIHWVEPQKKSRRILIDQIRQLNESMHHTAFSGGWKVGVLVDADRIQIQAANAFLKTLEEPPPRCLFLLLARNANALPDTIVSRCQRILLSSGTEPLPEAWHETLLNMLAEPPDGTVLGRCARVSRITALLATIRAEVEAEISRDADEEVQDGDKDTLKARMEARTEARYKAYRTAVLQTLALWKHDVLLTVCGAGRDQLHFSAYGENIAAHAADLTYRVALQRVRNIEKAAQFLERNLPETAVLQDAFRD